MTSTFDPTYTEFLARPQWTGQCLDTLAEQMMDRTDWETITRFYPMLQPPATVFEGPTVLPLDVTYLVPWQLPYRRATLPARNFDLRSQGDRVRLPTAQVYLFQTQDTADLTDDVLVALGSPTAGGDRVKVRGAQQEDRLCLFDFGASDGKTYVGCLQRLNGAQVSIPVTALEVGPGGERWAPEVEVRAVTTRTLAIRVTQALSPSVPLQVQVYPAHYPAGPGFAPTAMLTATGAVYAGQVDLPYPAADVAVRVWVDDGSNREAISQFRLQLPWRPGDELAAPPDFPLIGGRIRP